VSYKDARANQTKNCRDCFNHFDAPSLERPMRKELMLAGASECFGRINMRSFLSSPLESVGKGLKLTRNRSVGHGLASAEQSLCCF
jgi:hypothetical protein